MWPPDQASRIEFYGFHRADLLSLFVDRLPPAIIHTGHRCVGFEQDEDAGHRHLRQRRARNGRRRRWRRWHPLDAAAVRGAVGAAPVLGPGRPSRHRLGGERLLAGGRDAHLAGTGQALPCVSRARRHARQLCRVRQHRRADARVLVGARRPGRAGARVRGLGPDGGGDPARGEEHLPLGALRPRAAAEMDQRAPDAARRRRPPDAAARRPGRQPGDRGRRGAGGRAGPRRQAIGAARAAIYEKLRRERTASVQQRSRLNLARYYQPGAERDRALGAQHQERAWIWNYDAEEEAAAAAAYL